MASHRSINHCSLIVVAVAVLVVGVAALMKLLASGGGSAHEWQLAGTIPIDFRTISIANFPQLPENVCQIGRRRSRTAQAFHAHGQGTQIELRPYPQTLVDLLSPLPMKKVCPRSLDGLGIIC